MSKQQRLLFLFDVFVGAGAYYLAFILRFSSFTSPDFLHIFLKTLPIVILIKAIAFHFFELHRALWRYTSTQGLISILKAACFSTLGIIFVVFVLQVKGYPRSVPIIDWLLTVAFIGGVRFVIKLRKERARSLSPLSTRVLIIGAGDAGTMILKEMRLNPKTGYNPLGFIDDAPEKQGRTIYGIPILGTQSDISRLAYKYGIQEAIIAIPSASGSEMRSIVAQCRRAKIKFKTLPAFSDIINGTASIAQIKDVDVVDLLRREPIELDTASLSLYLSGKRVMVTGAGGSIGGELCRQIARFHPKELILLDMAETPLFWVEFVLKNDFPELKLTPFLCDIKDTALLEEILSTTRPELIYHAAAYKHVPVIEKNALQGIKNNVLGTKALADLAHKYGVENFVLISTDKAVNPKSFMGISKRINELYIQALAKESTTKFVAVRFGNVLDSSGSCLPIFKHQIRANLPITVTHPDAKRYFMTLPEAGQLIIQAGAMGKGGEIFILKMGDQIRILDLARDLLAFSGLDPDNAEFSFVGLRQGERLEEELIGHKEEVQLTHDENILIVNSNNSIPYEKLKGELDELAHLVDYQNKDLAIKKCKSIINAYS